jgi:hypothetical protein
VAAALQRGHRPVTAAKFSSTSFPRKNRKKPFYLFVAAKLASQFSGEKTENTFFYSSRIAMFLYSACVGSCHGRDFLFSDGETGFSFFSRFEIGDTKQLSKVKTWT